MEITRWRWARTAKAGVTMADTVRCSQPSGHAMRRSSPVARLTAACLINSYNYRPFIAEAIDSALAQTVPFDEVIVVDDGSTDGTQDFLASRYGDDPRIRLLLKDNGGQLSAYNAGFEASRADVLFFLDADDCYERDYLETALACYHAHPECDFLFCAYRCFGHLDREVSFAPADRDLGPSILHTLHTRTWVGSPSSCLSLHRRIARYLLPLPLESDWPIRADDCLVFGAAVVGGHKRFLGQPLVNYRVHGQNLHYGRAGDVLADYRHRLATWRLMHHLITRMRYDVEGMEDLVDVEFLARPAPDYRLMRQYLKLAWRSRRPLLRRLAMIRRILGHYLVRRSPGPSDAPD